MKPVLGRLFGNAKGKADLAMDAFLVQNLAGITSTAAFYDLSDRAERARSASDLQKLFYGLQRALQPSMFLEAGAFEAEASRKIRKLCPETKIVALEANPHNFRSIAKRIDYRKSDIEYLNLAASDKPGTISFKLQTSAKGESIPLEYEKNSILQRTEPGIKYEDVTVPSTTIDIQCRNAESVSLWIDVEGASKQVLAGAEKTLAKTMTAIIEVEIKPYWEDQWLYTDVCNHMARHGFLPVARDFEYLQQFNIVFVSHNTMRTTQVMKELEYYHSQIVGKGARDSFRRSLAPS